MYFGEITHAITAVEYTIDVLNKLYQEQGIVGDVDDYMILITTAKVIDEQTEILKELKIRL